MEAMITGVMEEDYDEHLLWIARTPYDIFVYHQALSCILLSNHQKLGKNHLTYKKIL
jgi:hypothetical protein